MRIMPTFPSITNRHPSMVADLSEMDFPYYEEATEPTIPNDTMAIWRDTTNNRTYIIYNRSGTQELVELVP